MTEKLINRIWSVKNIRNSGEVKELHVKYFFNNLPDEKKEVLEKAELRNYILTSENTLEHIKVITAEEGIYFNLTGCRCQFNIFCTYNGEIKRKPAKLNIVRQESVNEYR